MAKAQLIVSQPGRRMRRVEVAAGLVSIGRRADNTLTLEGDTNVSKYHAVIEERGGAYWLTDLGSSNGTLVNNQPLRGERKLADGDLINLGGASTVEFRLAQSDAADGGDANAAGIGAGGADMGGASAAGAGASSAGGAGASGAGLLSAAQGAQSGANSALSSASSSLSSASSAASSLGSFSPTARASSAASSALAPANSAMSSANSAMSSASSAASRATSAAAAPGDAVRSALAPRLIVGSVAGVTLVAVAVAILFATGAIGGGKKPAGKDDPASIDELLETPPAASSASNNASKNGDSSVAAPGATTPGATAPAVPPAASDSSGATTLPPAAVAASGDVSPQEVAGLSSMLASQITGRSGSSYTFDPNLVARIKQHLDEYRTSAGYYERARAYQGAVEKEFSNNKGITPLFAYLLAMSRTRFQDKGAGVWQLPPAVSKFYAPDMTPADASDPEKSARVAAVYTKALLDTFGKENFMYAVACYGMPISDAGNVITALQAKDPGGDGRFDFWKMKNAGVVGGEQIDNVARFFAAGIVCENPQRFGLRQDKPLSSLQ